MFDLIKHFKLKSMWNSCLQFTRLVFDVVNVWFGLFHIGGSQSIVILFFYGETKKKYKKNSDISFFTKNIILHTFVNIRSQSLWNYVSTKTNFILSYIFLCWNHYDVFSYVYLIHMHQNWKIEILFYLLKYIKSNLIYNLLRSMFVY